MHLARTAAIDMKVAACLPEAFLTVWYNVVVRAGLKPGETLLVHGGTSGIGNIAVQLGKSMNCRVIATAGSADKCQLLADIGADVCLNYNEAPLTEQCAQHGVLGVWMSYLIWSAVISNNLILSVLPLMDELPASG